MISLTSGNVIPCLCMGAAAWLCCGSVRAGGPDVQPVPVVVAEPVSDQEFLQLRMGYLTVAPPVRMRLAPPDPAGRRPPPLPVIIPAPAPEPSPAASPSASPAASPAPVVTPEATPAEEQVPDDHALQEAFEFFREAAKRATVDPNLDAVLDPTFRPAIPPVLPQSRATYREE